MQSCRCPAHSSFMFRRFADDKLVALRRSTGVRRTDALELGRLVDLVDVPTGGALADRAGARHLVIVLTGSCSLSRGVTYLSGDTFETRPFERVICTNARVLVGSPRHKQRIAELLNNVRQLRTVHGRSATVSSSVGVVVTPSR